MSDTKNEITSDVAIAAREREVAELLSKLEDPNDPYTGTHIDADDRGDDE
jgi:hypothetical protein